MKMLALAALLVAPPVAVAQTAPPMVRATVLPTNAEVWVTLDEEINSKGMKVGRYFPVSVSRDVMVGDEVVIPRGTPGVGEVTYRTGRGAFGKSGKMEVQLRSLNLNGRMLPIAGRFRQEGQGNTGATIGTIVAAGVIAGAFVTGHSAVFEQGREFRALTAAAVPVRTATVRVARAPEVIRPIAVALNAPVPVTPVPVASGLSGAELYQQKLAAARGIRGRETRLGWTISD